MKRETLLALIGFVVGAVAVYIWKSGPGTKGLPPDIDEILLDDAAETLIAAAPVAPTTKAAPTKSPPAPAPRFTKEKKQIYQIEVTIPITKEWDDLKKYVVATPDAKEVNRILRLNIDDIDEKPRVNAMLDNAFNPSTGAFGDVDYQLLDDWEHPADNSMLRHRPKFRIMLNIKIGNTTDWDKIKNAAGKQGEAERKDRLCTAYNNSKKSDVAKNILMAVHGLDPSQMSVCP